MTGMNARGLIFCSLVFLIVVSVGLHAQPRLELGSAPPAADPSGCDCEDSVPDGVAALVGDQKILLADVERLVEEPVSSLRRQMAEARQRELELQINSVLLQLEARRRGITPQQLLKFEVQDKTASPTEAEVRRYFEENRESFDEEYSEIRENLEADLRQRRYSEQAARLAGELRAATPVKILGSSVTPPANPSNPERVLATVNGIPVRSATVEKSLSGTIFTIEQEIYRLRQEALNRTINALLFEQEAARRKVTLEALLKEEVAEKAKRVDEEEAQTFYSQNRENIQGEYEQLKDQIVAYLMDRRREQSEDLFAEELKKQSVIRIFLAPPAPPVPLSGDSNRKTRQSGTPVTVVTFTDYECPSCARAHQVLERLRAEYGDRLKVVVRNFPLAQHASAQKAAEAAEAAAQEGKFWEYTKLLYSRQNALGLEDLSRYAADLGLDRIAFEQAVKSGMHAAKVRRDYEDGLRLGVRSTPTVFLNGVLVHDKTYPALKRAISSELQAVHQAAR
jgi:protein-disulfide isomerase